MMENQDNKQRHHFYEPSRPSTVNLTGFSLPKEVEGDVAKVNDNGGGDDANPLIVAVEAGGTSFIVAICEVTSRSATILPSIVYREEFDSSHDNPAKTLEDCAAFIEKHKPNNGYHALGIASFGPLGVNPSLKSYGKILGSSPKATWRNVDLLTPLKKACQGAVPLCVKVETDVNAPAMAEHLLRKNQAFSSTAYITVGTGIGVGLVVHHKPVHGRMHPEGGHVPVQPLDGDTFGGYSWNDTSPFGGINTVEGLACSVALTERYQKLNNLDQTNTDRAVLTTLPDNHPIWDHAANALANLCATLFLTLSMEQIVLGGGLMNRNGLLEKIQQRTVQLLNGYLELPDISTIVRMSQFGSDAGLMGTVVLAKTALLEKLEPNTTLTKEEEKKTKQEAFSTGLRHGVWVGAVGMALLCKYWWIPRVTRR